MPTTTKTESLAAALLAAQADFPAIHKGSTADTGKFSYTYASLPDLLDTLLPVLRKHGLLLTQKPVEHNGESWLQSTLTLTTTGESDVALVPLPTPVDWQKWGSAVTYARRYSLTAQLGIAPDDDDDAGSAQGFSRPDPVRDAVTRTSPGAHNGPRPGSSAGGEVCPEHNLPWRPTKRGNNAHPVKDGAGTLLGWCDQAEWEAANPVEDPTGWDK